MFLKYCENMLKTSWGAVMHAEFDNTFKTYVTNCYVKFTITVSNSQSFPCIFSSWIWVSTIFKKIVDNTERKFAYFL